MHKLKIFDNIRSIECSIKHFSLHFVLYTKNNLHRYIYVTNKTYCTFFISYLSFCWHVDCQLWRNAAPRFVKIQKYSERQDGEREISELKRVTAVQQPRDSRYAVLDEDTRSS